MNDAPRIDCSKLSIKQLSRLYRTLDALEETASMAQGHAENVNDGEVVTGYLAELQEYLFEERFNIVEALTDRPNTDDRDGHERLAVILQYEAWSGQFSKTTVNDFNASGLSREAM